MSLFTRTLLALTFAVGITTGCSGANFDVADESPSDDALLGVHVDGGSEDAVEGGDAAGEVSVVEDTGADAVDSGDSGDSGAPVDSGVDSGVADTGLVAIDTGVSDAGSIDTGGVVSDTGGVADTGGAVDVGPGVMVVTFPSETSATKRNTSSVEEPLGVGGGGKFFHAGDYVSEGFDRADPVTKISLSLRMSDYTSTYCAVGTLRWAVYVNSVHVGTYSWVGGKTAPSAVPGPDRVVSVSFPCAVSSWSGKVWIKVVAVDTVCTGGGNWNWYAGGTVTLE